jgi:hypothetical protein
VEQLEAVNESTGPRVAGGICRCVILKILYLRPSIDFKAAKKMSVSKTDPLIPHNRFYDVQ